MNIVITGGAGSIGSELARSLNDRGHTVVVFDKNSSDLVTLRQQIGVKICLGNTQNKEDVSQAFENADVAIHAASIKHVPLSSNHPKKVCDNNVDGLFNVLREAERNNIPLVNISTDKAVYPESTMGATKLIGEEIVKNAQTESCTIRLGNVLETAGSFIPIFERKAEANAEIPLTDPEMTRFVMTRSEVVEMVLYSIHQNQTKTNVIVPKLPSVRIGDVARILSKENDIGIRVIGQRPGEKKHERLLTDDESSRICDCDDYYRVGDYDGEAEIVKSKNNLMNKSELRDLLENKLQII